MTATADLCGSEQPKGRITMTDTALLPPDPTITAGWWVQCGVSDPILATWDAYDQRWLVPGSVHGSMHRYHLACPHPIPGPAALEAVWETLAALTSEQKWCEALPETDLFNQGRALGFEAAAAMLRAALETKETT